MLIVTTVEGREYTIKCTKYYEYAEDLIGILSNRSVIQIDYVESTDGTYILAKYIVSVRDV